MEHCRKYVKTLIEIHITRLPFLCHLHCHLIKINKKFMKKLKEFFVTFYYRVEEGNGGLEKNACLVVICIAGIFY